MTAKQKRAAKIALENGGNITAAMREAGYSESTINNPSNLTQSKAWEESLSKYFPDDDLLEVGREGLKATKPIAALVLANTDTGMIQTKENEGQIEVPDYAVRHKYYETALKLKRRLGTTEGNNFTINTEAINVVWSNGVKP